MLGTRNNWLLLANASAVGNTNKSEAYHINFLVRSQLHQETRTTLWGVTSSSRFLVDVCVCTVGNMFMLLCTPMTFMMVSAQLLPDIKKKKFLITLCAQIRDYHKCVTVYSVLGAVNKAMFPSVRKWKMSPFRAGCMYLCYCNIASLSRFTGLSQPVVPVLSVSCSPLVHSVSLSLCI